MLLFCCIALCDCYPGICNPIRPDGLNCFCNYAVVNTVRSKRFYAIDGLKAMTENMAHASTCDSIKDILVNHAGAWLALLAIGFAAVALGWAVIFASNNMPDNVGRELSADEQAEVIARNSSLASYVYLSPNANFPRTDSIRKITIHHMADNDLSLERLGETFGQRDRKASSNYAIDREGNIALFVEEANRAWTSGNAENDQQAITIEVENSEMGSGWPISDASYQALVDLCVDICIRNNIESLVFTGDPHGNLTYHHMFDENTECPGAYLVNKMPAIAADVNRELEAREKTGNA